MTAPCWADREDDLRNRAQDKTNDVVKACMDAKADTAVWNSKSSEYRADCTEFINSAKKVLSATSATSCARLLETLNTDKKDFLAACARLGLPMSIEQCAEKIRTCRRSSNPAEIASSPADYCPDSVDDDKIEKKLEKAEAKAEKLKDKIPDLKNQISDSQRKTNDQIAKLRQQSREALSEHAKQLKEASQKKDEKFKSIREKVSQLMAQKAQIDEQVGQTDLTMLEAGNAREQAKVEIDINCHTTASATVARMQAEALEMMKAGRYNRGNQTSLLKKVGLSDRDAWIRVAEKYYQWCKKSKPTIESKNAANRKFNSVSEQVKKAKLNMEKRKAALQAEIEKAQAACGVAIKSADPEAEANSGVPSESEACVAQRQAMEDLRQLEADNQIKQQGIMEDIQRENQNGMSEVMTKSQELARVQGEAADEETRVRNYRALQEAREKAGMMGSAKDGQDWRSGFAKWDASARAFNACCNANSEDTDLQPHCAQNKQEMAAGQIVPVDTPPSVYGGGPAINPSEGEYVGLLRPESAPLSTTRRPSARVPVSSPPVRPTDGVR